MVYNKNEADSPPAFNIDLMPGMPTGTPLNGSRWYQAEWVTDIALFTNAQGRTTQNFWSDGLRLSQNRNFRVALPGPEWDRFKAVNRHLFFRLGAGMAQDMSDWQWSVTTDILINHNPSADAGILQRIEVSASGTLTGDIVLDGSASSDPDPGSVLTYNWRLQEPPSQCFDQAFLDAIATRLAVGGSQVTAFPSGTVIEPDAEGSYRFEVEVVDDDPASFNGTSGKDTEKVEVIIGSCLNRICIDSPTSAAPEHPLRPEVTEVSVRWRMDPALHQHLQTALPSTHRLRLYILPSNTANALPIHYEYETPVPENGEFIWDLSKTDGSPAPAGEYDVLVELVDQNDIPLTIAGYATSDSQKAAVIIDQFSAKIDRRRSTSFEQLWGNANIYYEVTAPEPPDEIRLVITGGLLATPQEHILSAPVGVFNWAPFNRGIYQAQLVVIRNGASVAESELHEIIMMDDPVSPTLSLQAVGETTYTAASDPMAPASLKTHTVTSGDGYPAAFTINIGGLVRYPATSAGVDRPVAAGMWPLVFIIHGNHAPGVDSFLGFEYLARHLAVQGFIAVSVNEELLNGPFYPTIITRATVLNVHINRWIWKATNDPRFMGHVDLSRIALIGHSRGGEAVVHAASGAPLGATIRTVVSLSPTDFTGAVPSQPYLMMYGSVDADLIAAFGFRLYDRAAGPKAQVFVYGGTHNDICDHADWLPETAEPAPSRVLPGASLRAAVRGYVAAFLQWQMRNRVEAAFFFDTRNRPRSLPASVTTVKSWEPAGTSFLDRFANPPIAITDSMRSVTAIPAGAFVPMSEQSLRYSFSFPPSSLTCATPFVQQDTEGAQLGWLAGAAYIINLSGLNVSTFRVVTVRVGQAFAGPMPADPRNPLNTTKRIRFWLVDSAGKSASVMAGSFFQTVPYPYVRNDIPIPSRSPFTAAFAVANTKAAFTTLRIPLWAFNVAEPSLDLTNLASFRLEFLDTGLVILDDIGFCA
jgi:dienelactone hydrolase